MRRIVEHVLPKIISLFPGIVFLLSFFYSLFNNFYHPIFTVYHHGYKIDGMDVNGLVSAGGDPRYTPDPNRPPGISMKRHGVDIIRTPTMSGMYVKKFVLSLYSTVQGERDHP